MKENVSPISSTMLLALLGAWFCIALLLGASGIFSHARPPLPQAMILALVLVLLLLFGRVVSFRRWALGVDLRLLVALHLSRFVGLYFLALYGRGELPYGFAVPGGWGDIIVASTAVMTLIVLSQRMAWARPTLLLWNTFGMLDILGVVINAARLGMAAPESIGALLRWPLSLLATFLVPLIIF